MVEVGDEMANPRSGERFVWRATNASTGGAYCEFDLHLAAGSTVAAPHRHPSQEERFTVVSGALALTSAGRLSRLIPEQTGVIPPNTPHQWGNAGAEASHVVVRLTPALHIENYFAAFCAIATAGRAASTGLPRNPLQLAVLLDAFRAEFAMPTDAGQRVVGPALTAVGAIGRRLGYRSDGRGR